MPDYQTGWCCFGSIEGHLHIVDFAASSPSVHQAIACLISLADHLESCFEIEGYRYRKRDEDELEFQERQGLDRS